MFHVKHFGFGGFGGFRVGVSKPGTWIAICEKTKKFFPGDINTYYPKNFLAIQNAQPKLIPIPIAMNMCTMLPHSIKIPITIHIKSAESNSNLGAPLSVSISPGVNVT